MSRTLAQILWYIESKAARNEGVRLNNVEAKALAEHVTAVNERPKLLERVRVLEDALKAIGDLHGSCLLSRSRGPAADAAYSEGSFNAFNQCAGIARAALKAE